MPVWELYGFATEWEYYGFATEEDYNNWANGLNDQGESLLFNEYTEFEPVTNYYENLEPTTAESVTEYYATPSNASSESWWHSFVPDHILNDWGDDAKVFAYGVIFSFTIVAYKNLKR
jgi:hypothetical protein